MLGKFFQKNTSGGKYLALDIGTEVVKALVFTVDSKENKAVVIGVGREYQKPGNMRSGAVSDISGVIESSRKAIDIAMENARTKDVKQAIIGIAGELVKGTTTTVHYERVKPEVRIDLSEMKEIIEAVQEKAYERIEKQLAWETNQETMDIKLINAALVDVQIDGYKIKNPIGFQGRDVSISIFNAYAPLIHLGALEKIADELGVDILAIAAEPYAVSRAVGSDDDLDLNAVFIDIGGGTTDVAVVRNGGLEGTKMFGLGGMAFTKHLAHEFTLSFENAEKLKLGYSYGQLDAELEKSVRDIFVEDSRIWLGGLELALSEFSENDFLPNKILLCGGGSGLGELRESIMGDQWRETLPFAKDPQVSFLNPKDIANVLDSTGELTTPQDVTPMSLVAVALELLDEEKLLSGILRRTVKRIGDT